MEAIFNSTDALFGPVKLTASKIIKGITRVAIKALVNPATKIAKALWSKLLGPITKGALSIVKAVGRTIKDMISESMSQIFSKEFWVTMAKDGARELLAGILMSLGSTVYRHGTHKRADGDAANAASRSTGTTSAFSTSNSSSTYTTSNPMSRNYTPARSDNYTHDNVNKVFGFSSTPPTPTPPARPSMGPEGLFPPRDNRPPSSSSVWS
jgi:hypothetical protein